MASAATTRPVPGPSRIVVLFDVDTLRADRLGTYGYSRATSPHLDHLVRSGALVAAHAVTNAGWTLPAHASLFASEPVSVHGVRTARQAVPADIPLLAEILAKKGVVSHAITASGYVDARFGFARGFATYDFAGFSWHQASEEVAAALRLVDAAGPEPLFLFLHTVQVHNRQPTERGARGVFGSTTPLGPNWVVPIPSPATDLEPSAAATIGAWLSARYDGAIRETDESLGELVRGLEARGLWSRTALVFTSDHGEELGDRPVDVVRSAPAWGHTIPYLYEEHIHVPLVVRAPWRTDLKGRVDALASSLDVAPTILDLFDVHVPEEMKGTPLGRLTETGRVVVSEASPYGAIALLTGTRKMIVRPAFRSRHWETAEWLDVLPSRECFDLALDPGERHPTSCAEPWARELAQEADRYVAASFPGSIVLRADPHGSACRLAIGGADEGDLSFFGEPPEARRTHADGLDRVSLRGVPGPVWLGVAWRGPERGLLLDVAGCGNVVTASGESVPALRETTPGVLLWRGATPLPSGTVLFSSAPARTFRRAEAAYTPELVARLRSLGYVASDTEATPEPHRAAPAGAEPPVAPGTVRLRVAP